MPRTERSAHWLLSAVHPEVVGKGARPARPRIFRRVIQPSRTVDLCLRPRFTPTTSGCTVLSVPEEVEMEDPEEWRRIMRVAVTAPDLATFAAVLHEREPAV